MFYYKEFAHIRIHAGEEHCKTVKPAGKDYLPHQHLKGIMQCIQGRNHIPVKQVAKVCLKVVV